MADPMPVQRKIGVTALAVCGAYQVLLGLYFIIWRPSFLPEDLRFIDGSVTAVREVAPDIGAWLQWVFAVMGGQMVGVGLLAGTAAMRFSRSGRVSAVELLFFVLAAAATAVLMSAVNFAIASDFRWALLAPVALWVIALVALSKGLTR